MAFLDFAYKPKSKILWREQEDFLRSEFIVGIMILVKHSKQKQTEKEYS